MKRTAVLIFLVFTLLIIPSCGKSGISAGDTVSRALIEITDLPAGTVYRSDKQSGDTGYISAELANSLFGDGDFSEILGQSYDYSLFLPSGFFPCELGVFFCGNSQEADDLALMCCRRTDLIKQSISQGLYGGTNADTSVTVVYIGGRRAVIMAVGQNPDGMTKAVKHVLRNG